MTPLAGPGSEKRPVSRPAWVTIRFDRRPRKHRTAREPHVRSRIQHFPRVFLQVSGPVRMQQTLPPPRDLILEQLERMLASDTFAGAERSRALLRFIVEHVLENRPDRLKEYTIGSEALGRGDSFDPRTDPIVRAEASRLRSRIERYYATSGVADTILISLPRGSYVPRRQTRTIPESAPVATTVGGQLSTAGRRQRFIWFVLGGITAGAAVMRCRDLRIRARRQRNTVRPR